MALRIWDLFCRVIDNHGDLGVCLRLARDLAAQRGQRVRLWIDDPRALAWMAPQLPPACTVHAWPGPDWHPESGPGAVVVEAFGCDLPEAVQAALAQRASAPVWINLEYLSAEAYTLRSHRLPSPVMSGPAKGLRKWFWYPGFVPGSGGLLREPDLEARQAAHEPAAFLRRLGVQADPGERLVSLFCYSYAPWTPLLQALAHRPTLALACGGIEIPAPLPPGLCVHALPWLDQPDYDRLLWSCDLNIVRGEDSFVRAQWAGRPLLWHIYAQDDEAHRAKLEAFLALHLSALPADRQAPLRRAWLAWNRLDEAAALATAGPALFDPDAALAWRAGLRAQEDLLTQLLAFVEAETRKSET